MTLNFCLHDGDVADHFCSIRETIVQFVLKTIASGPPLFLSCPTINMQRRGMIKCRAARRNTTSLHMMEYHLLLRLIYKGDGDRIEASAMTGRKHMTA